MPIRPNATHLPFLLTSFLVCALLAGMAPRGLAQSLGGLLGTGKSTAAPAPPTDPLKRTTPRDAIYNFLEACHNDKYVLAAHYLDLHNLPADDRASQGPELAKQLAELLDRDTDFELERLSDSPEGNIGDGLSPDLETLLAIREGDNDQTLQMQRVQQQGLKVWLVSAESVARIPDLAAAETESELEKRMPAVLVRTKILGTPAWVWLSLLSMAVILSLLSRLLSLLFIAVLRAVTQRYAKPLEVYRLEAFVGPLRLLLSVTVFRALMELAAPSALLRDYVIKLLTLLFSLGAAALVMRIVDLISDRILSRLDARERTLSYSVLPLSVRVVKIVIFCLGVLFVLEEWGYNTNAILAGVGVGGLAVALAAQKTIENLFGGVALISDRPVLVGDFCQFGGQVGTVEDIGLRSTRIRTLDRTVVTIPNSSFSTMTLENYSRRDRMWFHPTLRLRRDTSPEQVRRMMDGILKVLSKHPMVTVGGTPLRFTKIGDQSFDIEVFAYVETPDYDRYLKVQTELLLSLLEKSVELGVGFAMPVVETLNVTVPDEMKAGDGFRLGPTPKEMRPLEG